jgi:hypothetical protein
MINARLLIGLPLGATALLAGLVYSHGAGAAASKFPDAHEAPPPGWKGKVFKLRTDYPRNHVMPTGEKFLKIDFRKNPEAYMNAVLDYCLEGNISTDFDVFKNKQRNWYHVPWLHWGPAGREFINGFTVELPAPPGKLGPNQKKTAQNISIGFYNDVAAYTIGQVWGSTTPNIRSIKFDEGAVTFKTLHVTATADELPFLKGSPTYLAYIPVNPGGFTDEGEFVPPSADRMYGYLRLFQIDIGVRDKRADDGTGWVFGTFVYDGTRPGNNPWKKLVPVGLHWGNSPGVTPTNGKPLTQQWINPNMQLFAWRQHPGMGYAGRMNGPLDNPESACLSCHGTGQMLKAAPLVPLPNVSAAARMKYFDNVKAGKKFLADGGPSTDYSLQMSMSVDNYQEWQKVMSTQRSPEALQAKELDGNDPYITNRQGSFLRPSHQSKKGGSK